MIARFDYDTKEIYGATVPGVAYSTFVFPIEGVENEFIMGAVHQVLHIFWDGQSDTASIIDVLFEVETDPAYARTNIHFAKIDPENRLYLGTTRGDFCSKDSTVPDGSFYLYTKERGLQQITGGIRVAGGYGWNLREKLYYGVDDCSNDVIQYSYTDDGIYCKTSDDL